MEITTTLHYIGMKGATDDQTENAATLLHVTTQGALLRGWSL